MTFHIFEVSCDEYQIYFLNYCTRKKYLFAACAQNRIVDILVDISE